MPMETCPMGTSGEGRFTFQGDPLGPTYASVVTTLTVESNGNLLLGGQVIASSVNSWWIGELTASGTFVQTFGQRYGSVSAWMSFAQLQLARLTFFESV
jgi:hypothetical protein